MSMKKKKTLKNQHSTEKELVIHLLCFVDTQDAPTIKVFQH